MEKLEIKCAMQIQKPINEVFEAIIIPEKMTNYFIASSTGIMEEGKDLIWKFPEFPVEVPVKNIEIDINRSISFVWDKETVVKIILEEQPDKSTLVKVTEDGKPFNEKNLKWAIENTEGWANFLACLKAYLEYEIQLRKGAFDFMR